jgi:hypothetical protein
LKHVANTDKVEGVVYWVALVAFFKPLKRTASILEVPVFDVAQSLERSAIEDFIFSGEDKVKLFNR